MSVKIVAIADTHRQHWNIKVPECDLFIFAGDAEINGILPLHDFNDWIGTIKASLGRVVIGGNHDSYLEFIGKNECKRLLTNCRYLENEAIEIEGLKIWGSPFSPTFNDWSFMKYDDNLKKIWDTISYTTDIVITHCPCYGILDQVLPNDRSEGSLTLRDRIKEIRPRIHLCGHIHEGYGRYTDGKTDYYNVSALDEMYKIVNPVTIIEV
jgi:Icc-related predicted phosphoesterase